MNSLFVMCAVLYWSLFCYSLFCFFKFAALLFAVSYHSGSGNLPAEGIRPDDRRTGTRGRTTSCSAPALTTSASLQTWSYFGMLKKIRAKANLSMCFVDAF